MKKCLITKLQESVIDSTLPVFQNVIFKNYLSRTVGTQKIDISSLANHLGFSDTKIDAVIKIVKFPQSTNSENLFASRGEISLICVRNSVLRIKASSTEGNTWNYSLTDSDLNTDIGVGLTFDSDRYPSMYVGSETHVTNVQGATGTNQEGPTYLLNSYSTADNVVGCILIKSIKIKKISTDELLLDGVPALVNDVPCLYNLVNNTPLYPNEGVLNVV